MNLKKCYLFDSFSDKELAELAAISFEKNFAAKEEIFTDVGHL